MKKLIQIIKDAFNSNIYIEVDNTLFGPSAYIGGKEEFFTEIEHEINNLVNKSELQRRLEKQILRTPSGELRELLTDINIFLHFTFNPDEKSLTPYISQVPETEDLFKDICTCQSIEMTDLRINENGDYYHVLCNKPIGVKIKDNNTREESSKLKTK